MMKAGRVFPMASPMLMRLWAVTRRRLGPDLAALAPLAHGLLGDTEESSRFFGADDLTVALEHN
jgi:hypothetical protein